MTARIQDWISWLRLSNRSESTVTAYQWELEHLAAWRADVDQLQCSDLLAYLAERRLRPGRKEEQLSTSAMKRSVNAMRSYYAFIKSEAAAGLPLPKPKLRVQRWLKFDEALALISICDTSRSNGKRDLAMVTLMLDTGLRAAEVCRLRLDQVDIARQSLHVVCKGGDDESGDYSIETANYLSAWLASREAMARCPNVFVSFNCQNYGRALTTTGLRCLFRALGKRAGLPHLAPHDLRRSFAMLTTLLGAPGRAVQEGGRWHDLKLVEVYTRSLTSKAIVRYSPVSYLMRNLQA
jgi:site-specific recombinase XerC